MDLAEQRGRQGDVVTHAQARAAGVPASRLRTDWVRVGAGAYVPRDVFAAYGPAQRAAAAVRAARLVTAVDLVAVGFTAAELHGLPVFGRRPERPQLAERKTLRPGHHGTSRHVDEREVVLVEGVPATCLARTAVDVARGHDLARGVVTADAVLARGVSAEELQEALESCARWPGITGARAAVQFADGRSESALESLGRVRFHQQGLVPPDLQVVLRDADGVIGRVDHYWEAMRTVAEADGALKYADREDLVEEKLREDRLRDHGEQVVRYTWGEALHRPQLLAARVLRAFSRHHRQAA